MNRKRILEIMLTLALSVIFCSASVLKPVTGWSNGGYSTDPEHPLYGTHDWIAQHALDWLPLNEKQYIIDNMAAYLLGTELPDNPNSTIGGIGDTVNHHVYYWSSGVLQDDASAVRASQEYANALNFLRSKDFANAAKTAGIMSHYIVDVAVFGHVMGSGTDWGPEVHHEDYETYVNDKTNSYADEFNVYLAFDGKLDIITAYNATLELAYDTTFGHGEGYLGCVWMDENYNWNNEAFKGRCGESLNLAVNYLADVLHTLYAASASTRYPWSMFHHESEHTGFTESPAPNTSNILWTYPTLNATLSSPAVAYGKVYVGSHDHKVYCLNALTGEYIWSYSTGNTVYSSPAVAYGRVYVGSYDCRVYCLDAFTGAYVWSYPTGGYVVSSPAVVDGKVYAGSWDFRIYCLDALTGGFIWSYPTGFYVSSSPAVADGKVYVGSRDGYIYCLDASTGGCVWSYPTEYPFISSPAVADGKVYVGSDDGNVYCLNASTGNHIWQYLTYYEPEESSPAVADGKVYVGSWEGYVYCLNASTGNPIWSYLTGSSVYSSPAVADGKVYVGSYDCRVYCLDAFTGAYVWSYTTGAYVFSSPAVADGVVYVGSYDNNVYAFGDVIRYPEDGYPTLQAAINAASPGTTISVALGTYHESIVINKPLTLIGRMGSDPIFEGGGSGIAITLLPGASGSTISGILITNWAQGIVMVSASSCKIYDNIFQKNNVAINLTESSTGNVIYHNNFDGNVYQAIISMSGQNIWDDGYPSGGNYWSDYMIVYPNAKEIDASRIWDTQYVINADNVDHYPLMNRVFITKVGDLGGGTPPQLFQFDGVVDGKDLALILRCYKKTVPPEAMYLADLGGGVPPKFYQCDGTVEGKDLALFLQCYHGQGP
jgi:parallel beta-helix repeat protein